MDSVAADELVSLLLEDPEQWLIELDHIDTELASAVWAQNIVRSRTWPELPYPGERWADAPYHGFLPIGQHAIETDPRLKNGLVRRDLEHLAQTVAVLPGDEYLYLPLSGQVNDTVCELLFLTEREEAGVSHHPLLRGATGQFVQLSGSITWSKWNPGRVAYRIAGYLDDPDVQTLVGNATRQWRLFGGGEDLAKRKGRQGRPRIPLNYEREFAIWQELKADYAARDGSEARLQDLADYLNEDPTLPDTSLRTLERRIEQWVKKEGKAWW